MRIGGVVGELTFIDRVKVPHGVVIFTLKVPKAPLYQIDCVVSPFDHDHTVPHITDNRTESPAQKSVSPLIQPIQTAGFESSAIVGTFK